MIKILEEIRQEGQSVENPGIPGLGRGKSLIITGAMATGRPIPGHQLAAHHSHFPIHDRAHPRPRGSLHLALDA